MIYPRVIIDIKKIRENVEKIVRLCNEERIEVAGVTKGVCAHESVVDSFVKGGVKYLADSRVGNLKKLQKYQLPKIMLRIPMISEVDDVVRYSDISLNSEINTVKALSKSAVKYEKTHKIILMIDLGDLREGYFCEEELYRAVEEILDLQRIKIIGIGTNLTCYGGVIPEKSNLDKLVMYKNILEQNYDLNLEIISGGNSSSLDLINKEKMPKGINNLRLGEAFLLGKETAYGKQIKGANIDAFTLEVEVIEVKNKPSIPIGNLGRDAFGKTPVFKDKSVRKRILCGIGRQDIELDSLVPKDKNLIIIGASSDHMILDGSDSKYNYKVGDILKFRLKYGGVLNTMTSEYVHKEII